MNEQALKEAKDKLRQLEEEQRRVTAPIRQMIADLEATVKAATLENFYVEVVCPQCRGTGRGRDYACNLCHGNGSILSRRFMGKTAEGYDLGYDELQHVVRYER